MKMCEHCKKLALPHRGDDVLELVLVELEDVVGMWLEWLCWSCVDEAVRVVTSENSTLVRVGIYGFELPRTG